MSNPIRKFNPRGDDEVFSDIPLNLDKNPVTGNLAKVTDAEAVKASLRNIIMTMQGEWPHYDLLGTRLRRALFQPCTPISASQIQTSITEGAAYEPRAQIVSVTVAPMQNELGYNVFISFYTVNSTTLHTYNTVLYRIR